MDSKSDSSCLNKTQRKFCPECGQGHASFWNTCEDCLGKRADNNVAAAKEAAQSLIQSERIRKWHELCPVTYRSTRWTDPEYAARLSPIAHDFAKDWWASAGGRGLGLWGSTGQGKTRAMFQILRRHHFAGLSCFAIQSTKLAKAAIDAVAENDVRAKNEARWLLRKCRQVYLLFIDDLGKERATPRVAAEIHEIWEYRTSHQLPILWTCERDGEWLAFQLGETYGDGLIRRIRGNSTIRGINKPN